MRRPRRRARRRTRWPGFEWPTYGYSKDRRRYLPTEPSVRPPFKLDVEPPVRRPARVPADHRRQPALHRRQRGRGRRAQPHDGQARLAARHRLPRRLLARLRRQAHLRDDPRAHEGRPRGPDRGAERQDRQGRVVAPAAQPQRVLAAVRRRPHLLRRRGRDRLRDAREGRQHAVDVPRRRRGQGRSRAVGGQALLRDLRRQRLRDLAARRASRSGTPAPAAPTSACGAGNFYATPAVAYGRVYIGNTDGNMYSFSAATGKLAWRRGTGSYVYASPAVAQVRDSKPTVYFGSYDGTFYALDARTRRHPLDVPRRRQDLRRRHRGGRHRLLLELGQARHDRASGRGRARRPGTARAAPSTPSSPTARPST